MKQQNHSRNRWQKTICLVGALLVFSAPVMASVCPGKRCTPAPANAAGECHEMGTSTNSGSYHAAPSLTCCQMSPNPPATTARSADSQEVKVVVSSIALESNPDYPAASGRILDSFKFVVSPPADRRSLLCVFLI